jgi:glycine cleavage system regulatory protein
VGLLDRRPSPSRGYVAGMEPFVLSIIGADRAGLVAALSDVVVAHGGSWERSHVTELAGVFAGVVLVRVPAERASAFTQALEPLREHGLLEVAVRAAEDDDEPPDDDAAVRFEVTGADRPGIVHEISQRLASLDVGIVDLRTWTESAAMAGSLMFRADALVRLPANVDRHGLVDALEDLAGDLMIDVADDPVG